VLSAFRERTVDAFLHTSSLFSEVDASCKERLGACFLERTFRPGDALVQPGEVTHLIALVLSGRLWVEQSGKAGQRAEGVEVKPGRFLAVTGAFSALPSRSSIRAQEKTTVALLPHLDLLERLREAPTLRALPAKLALEATLLDRDIYQGLIRTAGF
jgi:CRP-like cAMP-binding protein